MERKINILSICYTVFLLLLFLSGSLSGVLSEIVYFLAFLLPLAFGIFNTREEKIPAESFLTVDKKGIGFALPLVVPTVSVVMLVSWLTSLLIFWISGAENPVDVGDSLIPALFSHALLPAILEEALFRYLPMRLLSAHSKRATVLLSAFFFSLIHHDLFSIPYAFVAGVIFMMIDLATESVIPSVILHFINNAISVCGLIYYDNPGFEPVLFFVMAVLLIVSVICIWKNREEYLSKVKESLGGGEKIGFTVPMVLFAFITLFIAIVSLI